MRARVCGLSVRDEHVIVHDCGCGGVIALIISDWIVLIRNGKAFYYDNVIHAAPPPRMYRITLCLFSICWVIGVTCSISPAKSRCDNGRGYQLL